MYYKKSKKTTNLTMNIKATHILIVQSKKLIKNKNITISIPNSRPK